MEEKDINTDEKNNTIDENEVNLNELEQSQSEYIKSEEEKKINQVDKIATVAIVGRPNVGKSTLFNRLIRKRHAVVADEAGTTRDRISYRFQCNEYETLLVDTGGLQVGKQENIEEDIQTQAQIAIEDADIILFITDSSQELTADDFAAADILRKSEKTVLFIANKCDNLGDINDSVFNLYELGFGDPIKISAIHKTGIDELKSRLSKTLKELEFEEGEIYVDKDMINLCILGKPNAGKSSLVNALTGDEKTIVSEIAGTTRDATDTELEYKEEKFNLIDTAGLRRRGKIERGIERFSAMRCIQAIQRSDVVVLLIDGNKGITSQDCHIVQYALEEEKGLIIAINKIDLLDKGEEIRNRIIGRLRRKFAFVPWAPIIFISAKNKRNTYKILDIAQDIIKERKKRISTPQLNSFLQKITHKHLPTSVKMIKPKFMFGSQVSVSPPKFILFFKHAKNLHFSYPRYLENEIRKEYGFNGTCIQIRTKSKYKEDRIPEGKEKHKIKQNNARPINKKKPEKKRKCQKGRCRI